MREWQPIETAPMDGKRVLLYQPTEGGSYGPNPDNDTDYYIFTGWWDGEKWLCAEYEALSKEPTHWQPEPPPPSTQLSIVKRQVDV